MDTQAIGIKSKLTMVKMSYKPDNNLLEWPLSDAKMAN